MVAGAAAEISFEPDPDIGLGRVGVFIEEGDRRHDHPGGAIPALQSVIFLKAALHGMKDVAIGEALDGGH